MAPSTAAGCSSWGRCPASAMGWTVSADSVAYPLMKLTLAQVAPILPYLLLVLVLIVRPRGLFGTRDD